MDTASIAVTTANDAPVVDTGLQLNFTSITQDDTSNSGDLVSDLITGMISDVDLGAVEGIAITAADSINGSWEYSTDGGSTWLGVGAVSDSSARVLTATATDRLRFVPNAGFWGTVAVSIRGWDVTDGSTGGQAGVDASVHGGTTAFSSDTQTITLLVNDAPVLDNSGSPTLTSIAEDDATNAGDTVSSIVGALDLRYKQWRSDGRCGNQP